MHRLFLVLALIFISGLAWAGEQLDLATPPVQTTSYWRASALYLDWDGARIDAFFVGPNGEKKLCTWTGVTATTLMRALNKADLSTNSLHKRLLNRAVVDGCLTAGTVSGSPD